MPVRHFLSLVDLSDSELMKIINRGIEMKQLFGKGVNLELLRHRTAVMIFEKSSTRTRVSFETGVTHLGGNVIFLSPNDSQLGRGETVEDAARVLSRLASLIIVRTGSHARLARLAEFASVPVINGLSDYNHPCQLLADLQTWVEHRGDIEGRVAAWVGDGNNVCHSWMNAARLLGFQLRVATPDGYRPDPELVAECAGSITLTSDPVVAVTDADVVITDTWASMGQEEEKKKRESVFGAFQVNSALMREAKPDALFMHCLPAYRGMEVSEDVLEGEQSVVWDEAENRLHAQKALMEFLLIESAR